MRRGWRVLRLLGIAALQLWLVSLVVFLIPALMPGDPAHIALAERNQEANSANIAALRTEWGLDRPIAVQYLSWIGKVGTGEWGLSLRSGRPVIQEICNRLPWSAAIGGGGLLLAVLLCLPLGLGAALGPGGLLDRCTSFLAVAVQAAPVFLLAILLAWLLSAKLQWLQLYTGPPAERLLMPLLLVALYALPPLVRVGRQALLSESGQPYFLTALAKGLTPARAFVAHAGRPALLVLLAALTPQVAWAVGGTAVVEVAFAIPGLSQFVVESIGARDYAVLRIFILLIAILMIATHAAAGVARALIDRRPPS